MKLSVVVITKNEEAVIGRCLASVAWADERIVLDSGSSDATLDIARGLGASVEVTADWPGPATQRNRAIERARGEWILALDADEWITPSSREEIERTISAPTPHSAFRMPRLSSYCGRAMRHGGWWPDYVLRLFRRGHARFAGGIVHDRLVTDGSLGTLRSHLMHEAFVDLEEVLQKVNSYSTWGAQTLEGEGRRAGLGAAIAHGAWTFLRTYVLRGGFLDGRHGFMLAVSNAEGTYYKYAKLMLRERRDPAAGPRTDAAASASPRDEHGSAR
ncbi:MAG: glycosyltransferase family 2 protein [Burkholderiales bacterium]|nr:glycosyltransferase family 2 protein [Burkholderiales bacterium]